MKRHTENYYLGLNFPLFMRVKPTKHFQTCYKCGESIEKGAMQVVMHDGLWVRPIGETYGNRGENYESRVRSVRIPHTLFTNDEHLWVSSRNIYLHADCFFCMMSQLALMAHHHTKDCDKCDNRFKCLTDTDFAHRLAGHSSKERKPKIFRNTKYIVEKGGHLVRKYNTGIQIS